MGTAKYDCAGLELAEQSVTVLQIAEQSMTLLQTAAQSMTVLQAAEQSVILLQAAGQSMTVLQAAEQSNTVLQAAEQGWVQQRQQSRGGRLRQKIVSSFPSRLRLRHKSKGRHKVKRPEALAQAKQHIFWSSSDFEQFRASQRVVLT